MSDDGVAASPEEEDLQKLHDVNLEREGVRKLLDCDEKLVREVALRQWSRVAENNVSPRAKNNTTAVPPTKAMKQRSVTDSAICSDSFVTGWFPEKTRPLRKNRKEHSSKTRDGVTKDQQKDRLVWRDTRSKDLSDKYVFKHYRDTRKYMEQYRREHSCGATIHITKRVLSPKASDNLKPFPRKIQVYQVYSPSKVRKSEEAVELSMQQMQTQQSCQSNRDDVRSESVSNGHFNNDTVLSHHGSQENGLPKEGKSAKSQRSASQQSGISDPNVIFKYKLAPRYVQNMLEHHRHLQKQKLRSDAHSGRQHGSKHLSSGGNGHIQSGSVSPDWDDGTEIRGRQCSAKQTLSSRSGVKANLATTQVTISPLPSVPVVVSQPTNQTPISALAEKVVVNQNHKGSPPVLPRGNQKTLDNLSCLSAGDNQAEFSSSSDVSLGQLSTKCQGEKTWAKREEEEEEPTLSVVIRSHPLDERPCSAKQKLISKKSAHKNNSVKRNEVEDCEVFSLVKEKQRDVRPVLVKFMNKEGTLRQAVVELKGGNPDVVGLKGGNPEGELAYEYLAFGAPCEAEEAKERLSQTRSERQVKSAKIPEGAKRLVKSAQPEQVQKKCQNSGKLLLKRGSKSCHLSQPKPPPVPFFKFWGGSLPPEARCYAKRETKGRKDSGKTQGVSPSDVERHFDDLRESSVTSTSRKRSARKSARRKTGPPIASGMWFDSRGRAYVSLATRYEPLQLSEDVNGLPWKQKVGLLKVISEQGKKLQHAQSPRLHTRAASLTLPDIREGVSLDSDGGQSTGQRSSPGRHRTSVVSVCDSVNSQSGRSSVVSGIFSKTSLFTSIFVGKDSGGTDPVSGKSAGSSGGVSVQGLHGDCSPVAGSKLDIISGQVMSGSSERQAHCEANGNLLNSQPDELHVKPLQPKGKLEFGFLPEISMTEKFLVQNDP